MQPYGENRRLLLKGRHVYREIAGDDAGGTYAEALPTGGACLEGYLREEDHLPLGTPTHEAEGVGPLHLSAIAHTQAAEYAEGRGSLKPGLIHLISLGQLLFQNTLPSANRTLLLEYLNTDDNGNPLPFSSSRGDFERRVEELVGVMLSMPQWSFQ